MSDALRTLTGALAIVASAADRATLALEGARAEAAMQAEERLVRSLATDRLLRDLRDLRAANDIFPIALEAWLAEHLHLEPFLEPGDVREVPASQVPNYELHGDAQPAPGSLLVLKVLAPGWRWRGKVIVKPEVVEVR